MGFYESAEKMVAFTDVYHTGTNGRLDNTWSKQRYFTVYLCSILVITRII